jgi:hypothetical protein
LKPARDRRSTPPISPAARHRGWRGVRAVPIVINHTGGNQDRSLCRQTRRVFADWRRRLARTSNVHVKLGGLGIVFGFSSGSSASPVCRAGGGMGPYFDMHQSL